MILAPRARPLRERLHEKLHEKPRTRTEVFPMSMLLSMNDAAHVRRTLTRASGAGLASSGPRCCIGAAQ